ncbi:MAG TPA: hypothetical protein VGM03_10325 [Phycisphaerae bacterium]
MGRDAVPEHVRNFIAEHVRSLKSLELLLMLHADPGRAWTGTELGRELRAAPEWAQRELEDLAGRGLAAPGTAAGTFRYAPRRTELDETIAMLAALYPERRFTIIQIIFGAPEPIQSFADAFKLRKDPSDG